jgi:ankyrin repeat protein
MSAKTITAIDDAKAQELGRGIFAQGDRQFPDMNDILWLIRNGASMSVTDKNGMTPLLRAMNWGNKALIREMVAHSADVNYAGSSRQVTPLQIAVSGSDPEIVRLMLDAGGDLLKKNSAGANALDIARRNTNTAVLALVEEQARIQQAAVDAVENHRKAIDQGLPVEKPFKPMKRLTLKRG